MILSQISRNGLGLEVWIECQWKQCARNELDSTPGGDWLKGPRRRQQLFCRWAANPIPADFTPSPAPPGRLYSVVD